MKRSRSEEDRSIECTRSAKRECYSNGTLTLDVITQDLKGASFIPFGFTCKGLLPIQVSTILLEVEGELDELEIEVEVEVGIEVDVAVEVEGLWESGLEVIEASVEEVHLGRVDVRRGEGLEA
jgi:hypothetical protein